MVTLCVTAVFWLLVSPLTPPVNQAQLIALTFGLGVPLGLVGVALNHWVQRDEARPRRK